MALNPILSFKAFISACELDRNLTKDGAFVSTDQFPLIDFLQEWDASPKPFALVLTPRYSLKSTIAEAFTLWRLLRNPQTANMILCATQGMAKDRLRRIKNIVTSVETFRSTFGARLKPSDDSDLWNADRIHLSIRQGSLVREPSIFCSSLGGEATGLHPDFIFADDLSCQENSGVPEARQKVIDDFQAVQMLMGASSKMLLCGTYWGRGSEELYSWIEAHIPPSQISIFKTSCWSDVGETIPLYPHTLSVKRIEYYKATLPATDFAGHYLLQRLSSDTAIFREEWLQHTMPCPDFSIENRHSVRIYAGVDPAGHAERPAQRKQSDFFSIVVVAALPHLNRFCILDGWHGRGTWGEHIQQSVRLLRIFKPDKSIVERSLGGAFTPALIAACGRERLILPIEQRNPGRTDKKSRIISLEPLFSAGAIYFSITCDQAFRNELTHQLVRFGQGGAHDDLPDSLWYALSGPIHRYEKGFQGVPAIAFQHDISPREELDNKFRNGDLNAEDYAYWKSYYQARSGREDAIYDLV